MSILYYLDVIDEECFSLTYENDQYFLPKYQDSMKQ